MEQSDIKLLWDEYRINAALGSHLQIFLDLRSIYRMSHYEVAGNFLREQAIDDNRLTYPSPGSQYWTETLSPPPFFLKMLDLGNGMDPVEILKSLKRSKKKQKPHKRLTVGHAVKVSLNIKSSRS